MANLETLELTINANAQSARQGVQNLISSLSSLATQVQDAFNKLSSLNAELRRLAGLGGSVGKIKLPSVSTTTGARRVSSSARQRMFPAEGMLANPRQMPQGAKAYMADGRALQFVRNETEAQRAMAAATNDVAKATKNEAFSFKQIGKSLKDVIPKFTLFHKIARLASTMLLRMGLRAAFKGIKEGFDNYYQYAKANNLVYAQQMDQVSSSLAQLKNQAGASLASALSAALPVLNAIASAAINAFNALSQLFALLTGKSSWSKATQQATEYGDAAKKAGGSGGGLKEQLAAFDELNVIASESGGGGGGAAKAAEDFTTMFTESYEFDKGIRDTFTWLEEHLPLVNAGIAAIAASLLGLPASITITITGVALSFSAGYDIGLNGLNSTNFWEAAGGVLATGLGGALLGFKLGGGIGAAVGFTMGIAISLLVTAIGIDLGQKDALYGTVHMDAEEIKQQINQLFTLDDVYVTIQEMKVRHDSFEGAKERLLVSMQSLLISYSSIEIGADLSDDTIDRLKQKVDDVVQKTNIFIEEQKIAIKAGLELTTQFEDPKEVINFSNDQLDSINSYVADLAKQISDVLTDGITIDEQSVIEDLMTKMTNITNAITMGQLSNQFMSGFSGGYSGTDWGNVDRETFMNYFSGYATTADEFKEALRQQAQDASNALAGVYYGMVQREKDNPGTYTEEQLNQAKSNWENYDIDAAVNEWWNEYGEAGRQVFVKNAETAFKGVVGKLKKWNVVGVSDIKKNYSNLREWFVNSFAVEIGWDQFYGGEGGKQLLNVFDTMEITGWDLLEEEMKKQTIYHLQKVFGKDSELYKQLKSQLGVPVEDILATNRNQWESWNAKEKIEFINALNEAYGSDEVAQAAEGIGFDIAGDIERSLREGVVNEINKHKEDFKNLMKITGGDIQTFMNENWNLVTPLIDTFGTKQSLEILEEIAKDYGKGTQYVLDDWNLIAPYINETNYKKTLQDIRDLSINTGVSVHNIMANWGLVAPTIEKIGLDKSIEQIKKAAKETGTSTQYILEHWDLFAPYINDKGYNMALYYMKVTSKETGVDIQELLNNWKLIAPIIDEYNLSDSLTIFKTLTKDTGVDLVTILKDWKLIAPFIDKTNVKGSAEEIAKLIKEYGTEWKNNIPAKLIVKLGLDATTVTEEVPNIRKSIIDSFGNKILIPVGLESDGSSLKTTVSGSGTSKTVTLTKQQASKTAVAIYATGAYDIGAGDLFIANERGAEMVGSINGKSSVANQQQIVEGIASGVASANAEQNSLLREQNSLLRGILEKEASVKFGASAALGRTVRQSLDMYGAVSGV